MRANVSAKIRDSNGILGDFSAISSRIKTRKKRILQKIEPEIEK